MAEAVLFNIADGILKMLGSPALQEIGLLWGVKDELGKLENTVSTIKAVLLDAEERHASNHEVRDWLGKLKDAVYDADDLLDDFYTEALRRKVMTQNRAAREVRIFFSSSNQLAFGLKMGHKIKAIRERLTAISLDRTQFHFVERPMEMRVENRERKQTHSFVPSEAVIGRDDDKSEIIRLLLDSNTEENFSVLSIVGIGGLGKTTLAQFVYNDEIVQKNFELKMWVCVSNVFDVSVLMEKIVVSATGQKLENLGLDQLQNYFREVIEGKKYLLILDDVWNDDKKRWLELKKLLMGGARGSRIIITSRSIVVAKIMGTVAPYFLRGLPENKSLSLFKQVAFGHGQEAEISPLFEIGKEIVMKCAGVPLAIATLGSLLCTKDTKSEWLSLKDVDFSKITQDEDGILPILKLSYDHLPAYLKQCFAYCSLFPKDYDINKQILINLWIAQGFIQPLNENQCLEDVGHEYFMDLSRRCFFQDLKRDEWGNVVSCKMHDLMHDVALSIAGIESSMVTLNAQDVTKRVRHVSFDSTLNSSWNIPNPLLEANKIRSILLPTQLREGELSQPTCNSIISSFKCLRVLDLHDSKIMELPSFMCKLKHLRYLDLSGNEKIKRLPKSITRLLNLQTLRLVNCLGLEELPRDIRKLVRLRHLEIDGCGSLTHMPPGLGQITSLQTLSLFVVSKDSQGGGLSELFGLNNLRGNLAISNLEYLKIEKSKHKAANLKGKTCLQSLSLTWNPEETEDNEAAMESLLDDLQANPNLKELLVCGFGGMRFPSWTVDLPSLVNITIERCDSCVQLPALEQLPSLKFLKLTELKAVEYIENKTDKSSSSSSSSSSTVFFPSLEVLFMHFLPKLKGWWQTGQGGTSSIAMAAQQQISFPRLSVLSIDGCPNLMLMPLLSTNLQELRLCDVNEKMVRMAMVSSPLSKLKSLHIELVEDLEFVLEEGLQKLTSLELLEVWSCPRLMCLTREEGFKGLTSLRSLGIYYCQSLRPLSQGIQHLTALEELKIKWCGELEFLEDQDGIQWQGLCSLRSLTVEGIPMLASLPEGLQHVTALQHLELIECHGLMTLPEWMGSHTSLHRLAIDDCPHLKERCKRDKGEDWPKISHIPVIEVDGEMIQGRA